MVKKKMKYLRLEDLNAYQIASELSDYVWKIVIKWDWFTKKTVGSQWVESTDSIAGNIAEGFGRYHKRDKQKFYYNARGSVYESAHWTKKVYQRGLISKEENSHIIIELRKLPKEINSLVSFTEKRLTI